VSAVTRESGGALQGHYNRDRHSPIGQRVGIIDRRTVSVLTTILLFVAVGALVYGARSTLIAFLFAIFFAYLLDPAVSLAERRLTKGSRGRAILLVYLGLLGLLIVWGFLVGPRLADEARGLATALPGLLDKLETGQIAQQIGSRRGWSFNTQARLAQFLAAHQGTFVNAAGSFGKRVASLASHVVWIVLVPVLAIFFLRDGRAIAESAIETVDQRSQRQFLRSLSEDIDSVLASYIRAQLTLAVISLVAYLVVLEILRVPYAIVMGTLGGIMEFIPVVGPLTAAAMIMGIAFIANYHHLLVLVIFLGCWRLIQDYVNSPRIMGSKLRLHPLAVLFAVLVGGEIGGVIGVYLSIPIMATLRIFWRRYQRYTETQQAKVRPETDIRAA
jgi:predicted PurR-regulated permease PerM